MARSLRLDPLRRQVHAFVFHKHDPKKRRLSLVTSIEGFRAIAARTGDYRPDENEPSFIADDGLKAETNPAGLISCAVRVWQYAHGQWFPITGVARWDEFAPLKTVWVDKADRAQGPRQVRPLGRHALPDARQMRGRASNAHSKSRPSSRGRRDAQRIARIGGRGALIIDWLDAAPLNAVPLGQLADRIVAFLRERREDPHALLLCRERNRHALREFWARSPADTLGVKQEFEKALAQDGKPTK